MAKSPDEDETASDRFELRPGVIVDSIAGVAYLMNPQHGIDAIDLSSGKVLWTTKAAAKPIALFDRRLAAQAEPGGDTHVLPIVVLDTNDGGKVISRLSVPMPGGAWPSIDEGLGTSFMLTARFEQDHLLILWSASRRMISGIARPGPPPESKQDGAALIDLQTGVEILTPGQARSRLRAAARPAKPPRLSGSEVLLSPPQPAGKFLVATEALKGEERAVLKRWNADSGEPLPDVDLSPGFNLANPSADGSLVLTSKPVGADAAGFQNYLWSIYSLSRGDRVAELKMFLSSAPFFSWRSTLIYVSPRYARQVNGALREEPLELRALNTKSATEIWKTPIRDTAYHGPTPPAP